MGKAIIVIDMQNDFVTGSLGSERAKLIVPKIAEKLEEFKRENASIYFTMDTHDKFYLETLEGKYLPVKHCIGNTPGWCIVDELFPYIQKYNVIQKEAFGYTKWDSRLVNSDLLTEIMIVGVCTDICVVSNALILRAMLPKCKIVVDASCCAGTTKENHEAALKVVKSCQIEVINED